VKGRGRKTDAAETATIVKGTAAAPKKKFEVSATTVKTTKKDEVAATTVETTKRDDVDASNLATSKKLEVAATAVETMKTDVASTLATPKSNLEATAAMKPRVSKLKLVMIILIHCLIRACGD
jgi:hypothetical protein